MNSLDKKLKAVPANWKESCVNTECTLHQLSPYIGKLKSIIARDLISTYSNHGDLVIDPFCGSGTIPLEARLQGRRSFAADINPYAEVLCRAKLEAPPTLENALKKAEETLNDAYNLPDPDLRKIPAWVRSFFHPRTLKEAIKFATVCKRDRDHFSFACFLGILHHQRPGFLSYPSSHLVPYLRDKKYPRENYPELYAYRDLRPRLLAKVDRAYARNSVPPIERNLIYEDCPVERLIFPEYFDCLITSPPYMNALDYNRDNRLRLWFINSRSSISVENKTTTTRKSYRMAIVSLAKNINLYLKSKGFCILIIGEQVARSPKESPANLVRNILSEYAHSLRLTMVMKDNIPDIRRSRRECRGTKAEHFLVFQKA